MIGYGTDVGPEGICYRADLFEKAGLPTDREEVAALIGTTGTTTSQPGDEFVEKVPDTAWYDSSGATRAGDAQPGREPLRGPRTTPSSTTDNPELKAVCDTVTGNADDGLSTKLAQWSDDWTASFQNDGFATMACPGWMLGVIEGNAEGVEGWDIANVFPGGGGNWGGSYLTVPAQGDNVEEAKELAAWLTAPEQQVKAFEAKGTFPSQVDALDDPELIGRGQRVLQRRPHRPDPGRARRGRHGAALTRARSTPTSYRRSRQAILRVDEGAGAPTSHGSSSWPTSSALG